MKKRRKPNRINEIQVFLCHVNAKIKAIGIKMKSPIRKKVNILAMQLSIIKRSDIMFALRLGLVNSQSVITHYGAKNQLLTYKEAQEKIKGKHVKVSR